MQCDILLLYGEREGNEEESEMRLPRSAALQQRTAPLMAYLHNTDWLARSIG